MAHQPIKKATDVRVSGDRPERAAGTRFHTAPRFQRGGRWLSGAGGEPVGGKWIASPDVRCTADRRGIDRAAAPAIRQRPALHGNWAAGVLLAYPPRDRPSCPTGRRHAATGMGAAGSIAIEALRPRRVAATIARHLGPGAERAADPRQRLAGGDDPVRRDSLLDPGLDGGQRIEIIRRSPAFAVHHPRHQEQARPILGLAAGIMRQAVVP